MTTIGENVKRYRKLFGWSQHELSRRSGVTQASVSMIESGNHSPHFRTMTKLATALQVPISALVDQGPIGPPERPKTPRTDEPEAKFDKRFARTRAGEAAQLREELSAEHAALEKFVKDLHAVGLGDEAFQVRRARARLELARMRLFAVQLRQGDLDEVPGREAHPKDTVAEYIPSAADAAETLRLLLGDEAKAG